MKKIAIVTLIICFSAGMVFAQGEVAKLASFSQVDAQSLEAKAKLIAMLEEQLETGRLVKDQDVRDLVSNHVKSSAEKTFKSYIADPIPQKVQLIDGDSVHWQGFSAQLIFTADQETFEALARGYKSMPVEDIKVEAKKWFLKDITASPNLQCFKRSDDFNTYYLLWDQDKGRVYFKGLEDRGTMSSLDI